MYLASHDTEHLSKNNHPPVVEDFVEVINFNFNELTGVQRTFQGPLKVLFEKSEENMVCPGLDPLKIPYLAFSFQLHQIPSQGYLNGARFFVFCFVFNFLITVTKNTLQQD